MRRFFPLLALLAPWIARAELSPSAYEAMQAGAPEFIEMEVLRVGIGPGASAGQQVVSLTVLVTKISRTATALRERDLINITYVVTEQPKGHPGPREIPLLAEKDKTVAYLVKNQETGDYAPAARAMSFRSF